MLKLLRRLFGRDEAAQARPAAPLPLDLPFPYETAAGRDALQRRRGHIGSADVTPVIMGGSEDIRLLRDLIEASEESPAQIVETARALDIDGWLRSRRESDEGFYQVEPAEWPGRAPRAPELSVHLEVISKRPKKQVIIGLPDGKVVGSAGVREVWRLERVSGAFGPLGNT